MQISAARISGMEEDLQLYIGDRYTIALVSASHESRFCPARSVCNRQLRALTWTQVVFFPPYMLIEFPSNIILRYIGTRHWLALLGFCWGTVMLGQGFVKNYSALAACRAFLGLFEGLQSSASILRMVD